MSITLLHGLKRATDNKKRLMRRSHPMFRYNVDGVIYEVGEADLLYYQKKISNGKETILFSTIIEPFLRESETDKNEGEFEEDLSNSYEFSEKEDYYTSDGNEFEDRESEMDW